MENLKENMLKLVKEVTAEEMSPICESWLRTFGTENVAALTKQFRGHYKLFVNQITAEILETEAKLKTRVENLLSEQQKLEQQLDVVIINSPVGAALPLYPYMKQIEEKVSVYREQYNQRLAEIATLRSEEELLRNELGNEPRSVDSSKSLMSTDEFQQFQNHVKGLSHLKESRIDDIKSHQSAGKELLGKLGSVLETNAEIFFVDRLQPTLENVKKLQAAVYELESIYSDKEKRIMGLWKRLNDLWDELKVQDDQRFELNSVVSEEMTKKLTDELERCEKLKLSKLPQIIEHLRSQTIEMSKKCYKSMRFKHQSAAFQGAIYTEMHQKRLQYELIRLEGFYKLNEDILKLIAEREDLKAYYTEHSQKLLDSKDRFKNRGGKLLKDEKERKLIEKNLQKVEAALAKEAEAYEAKYNSPFLVYDEPIQINLAASPSKLSKGLKRQQSLTDLRLKKPFSDRSNIN